MPSNHQRESAQIFQFPVGGRAGLEAQRNVNVTSLAPRIGEIVTEAVSARLA